MAEHRKKIDRDEIKGGLICALPIERAAVIAMLDEKYDLVQIQDDSDHNNYVFGQLAGHKVAVASLPEGLTGTNAAAIVARQLSRSFSSIQIRLMVGIGGGVWSKKNDVRLGDVVVSRPDRQFGGVVQYDLGKRTPEGKFERTGSLDKPPSKLLLALSALRADCEESNSGHEKVLFEAYQKNPRFRDTFSRPDEVDELYQFDYEIDGTHEDCKRCDKKKLVERPRRKFIEKPEIHYGIIASGNSVIRSATQREKLNQDLGGILCFEMEAAGLMHDFQCLVIRGICDYADSHKNKRWQRYAAATAAAYAKLFLTKIHCSGAKGLVATQSTVSFMGQSPPGSGLPFVQPPAPYYGQLLPGSPYSPLQQGLFGDRFPLGFGQDSAYRSPYHPNHSSPKLGQLATQQKALLPDQSPPASGQVSAAQSAFPSNQSSPRLGQLSPQQRAFLPNQPPPTFGQQPAYQRALPSAEASLGFGQQSASERALHSAQSLPRFGQLSSPPKSFLSSKTWPKPQFEPAHACLDTNQASAEQIPRSFLKPPHSLHKLGHSDTDLMRYGGNKGTSKGIRRKAVGSLPGVSEGYRQTTQMVYSQPPRIHQPRPSCQPRYHEQYRGSPIPLHPLPATNSEPRQSINHNITHVTNYDYIRPSATEHASWHAGEHVALPSVGAAPGAVIIVETGFRGQGDSKPSKSEHGCDRADSSVPEYGNAEAGDGGSDSSSTKAKINRDVDLLLVPYPVTVDGRDTSSKGGHKGERTASDDLYGRDEISTAGDEGGSTGPDDLDGRDASSTGGEVGGGTATDDAEQVGRPRDIGRIDEDGDMGNDILEDSYQYDGVPNHHSSCLELGDIPHESIPDAGGRTGEAAEYYNGYIPWSYQEPEATLHNSTFYDPVRRSEAIEQDRGVDGDYSDRDISDVPSQPTKQEYKSCK